MTDPVPQVQSRTRRNRLGIHKPAETAEDPHRSSQRKRRILAS